MQVRMFKHAPRHRIQKSRKLLHQALISLILEKSYESITVQQILDRASVGRSTFYTHFRDKDELLIMGFEHLREILDDVQRKTPAATEPYEKVIGFSPAMFEHLYEYRNEWKALQRGSQAGIIVRQSIEEMISSLVERQFKAEFQKRGKNKDSAIPFELFVKYLAATFMSVTSWWLESKNPLAPDAVDNIYRALVTPSLKSNFD